MIVTVTLNPSLDRTVEIDRLTRGAVLRADAVRLHPGGKGVNVTRALLAHAVPSRAVLPVAGPEGAELVALLQLEGVATTNVGVEGRTRSNITVAEADGTVTKLNEPGPALDADGLDLLLDATLAAAVPGGWVVLCGSLPPGVPEGHYATMTEALHRAGCRVAVDTSGPALRAALAARPDLVKPNADELAEAAGCDLRSRTDVVQAAERLRAAGAGEVLVSLGADGGILVGEHGVVAGTSTVNDPRSTVGAGDAFLAGFLAAEATQGAVTPTSTPTPSGADRAGALAQALAWGAAAVRLPGSQMPGPADVDPTAVRMLPAPLSVEHLTAPLAPTG